MTRTVKVKNIEIGGGSRIKIQTMADIKTSKVEKILDQINELYLLGCDLFRVSVKDNEDALALKNLVKRSPMPIIADIHFDYKLAIAALDAGVAKIRINPGNIGGNDKVGEVAAALKQTKAAVRVGSNGGSLEKEFYLKYGRTAKALAESALKKAALLEGFGVSSIVLSAKASDCKTMVEAYRYLHNAADYPLHLGVTEAGTLSYGIVKGSIGIGALLIDGIGDTIRVSLTADKKEEIFAAKRILRSVGLDKNYVEIISCPTCGRTAYDLKGLVEKVEKMTASITKPLKVAVMGCVVNGPGEAKDCELGIAGGDGKCVIFKKGEVFKTVSEEKAAEEFLIEIKKALDF